MESKDEDNDENSENEQSSDDNKTNNNIHHDNSIEILEPSIHKNISHFNTYKKR